MLQLWTITDEIRPAVVVPVAAQPLSSTASAPQTVTEPTVLASAPNSVTNGVTATSNAAAPK